MRLDISNQASRLSSLENKHESAPRHHSAEIDQLKELRRRGSPTAELRVGGIPGDYKEQIDVIVNKILNILKLQDLCADILEIREIKPKNVANNDSEQASEAEANTTSNKPRAIVVKFKSHYISQHVMSVKRKHGTIKQNEVIENGTEDAITIFDMLPPFLQDLHIRAQERARETCLACQRVHLC